MSKVILVTIRPAVQKLRKDCLVHYLVWRKSQMVNSLKTITHQTHQKNQGNSHHSQAHHSHQSSHHIQPMISHGINQSRGIQNHHGQGQPKPHSLNLDHCQPTKTQGKSHSMPTTKPAPHHHCHQLLLEVVVLDWLVGCSDVVVVSEVRLGGVPLA